MKVLTPLCTEYVISSPHGKIVLRPFRQPITDYLIVPKGGLLPHSLFAERKKFPDGAPKESGIHTNMILDGQLGHPCLFDLCSFRFHVARCGRRENVFRALRSLQFHFVYGQNNQYVNFSGADLKPFLHLHPEEETPKKALDVLREELKRHANRKGYWSWYTFPVLVGGHPRRIDSMEQFRLEVQQPLPLKLSSPVHFKVLMDGILYHP